MHEDRTTKREESLRAVFEAGCPGLRACLEGVAGEPSYLYALEQRTVLLYWGRLCSLTKCSALGGVFMEL